MTNTVEFLRRLAVLASCWHYEHFMYPEGWGLVTIELDTDGFKIVVTRNKHGNAGRTESTHKIIPYSMALHDAGLLIRTMTELAEKMELSLSPNQLSWHSLDVKTVRG